MGGSRGLVVLGRGGDVAGGGRCSMGALGGRGREGRGRGGGVGGAMSPGSARMVVLAWCGGVWAVVADWAAGFGCCGMVVVVGAGGGGVVGVPRGSGRGVVRSGWTRALVGRRALLAGALAGPLTCLGLLGLVDPRGGDGERACQRCASWRLVLRPLT